MAQDKDIQLFTGLFMLASIILLGIDIITLGNVSLNSLNIVIFNGFAKKVLELGIYDNGRYYMIRIFIIALLFYSHL